MATFVGRRVNPKSAGQVEKPKPEPKANSKSEQKPEQKVEQKADKTRAELVEEAEDLGIDVPKGATKAQIQKLIEEAPVM